MPPTACHSLRWHTFFCSTSSSFRAHPVRLSSARLRLGRKQTIWKTKIQGGQLIRLAMSQRDTGLGERCERRFLRRSGAEKRGLPLNDPDGFSFNPNPSVQQLLTALVERLLHQVGPPQKKPNNNWAVLQHARSFTFSGLVETTTKNIKKTKHLRGLLGTAKKHDPST